MARRRSWRPTNAPVKGPSDVDGSADGWPTGRPRHRWLAQPIIKTARPLVECCHVFAPCLQPVKMGLEGGGETCLVFSVKRARISLEARQDLVLREDRVANK